MSMTPETPLPPRGKRIALRPIPMLIFGSRWLQLPLYVRPDRGAGRLCRAVPEGSCGTCSRILRFQRAADHAGGAWLIDVVMISNLLVMVIVGGYETFVSRLNLQGHPDEPEWLTTSTPACLKIKLAMAIIGISSIHLLRTFIEAVR